MKAARVRFIACQDYKGPSVSQLDWGSLKGFAKICNWVLTSSLTSREVAHFASSDAGLIVSHDPVALFSHAPFAPASAHGACHF